MVASLVTVVAIVLSVSLRVFGGALVYYDGTVTKGSKCRLSDGEEGECGTHCVENSLIQTRSDICGFERDEVLLCCRNKVKVRISLYPTIDSVCQNRSNSSNMPLNGFSMQSFHSRRKRQEPLEDKDPSDKAPIRSNRERLILTDDPHHVAPIFKSFPNEHPHMAVLGWTLLDNTIDWECGGSLIHPSYVLTAAHCIYYREFPPGHVRIGGVDLYNDEANSFVVDYIIKRIYIHPNYSYIRNYNDIALILVVKSTERENTHEPQPACIWTNREIPHEKLLIMGYGAPSFGMTNNYALYQGNLTVLEYEDCNKHYEKSDHLPQGIIDSQFCAFDPERKLDTCQGDSGGPIQFNDNSTGKPYIVGVTSFGTICLSETPGVYTRIYPYLGWIENQISREVKF